MISELTIVCTCSIHKYKGQKRPTYSKMWVDRLYKSCKRNISIPFDFVCLSNDIKATQEDGYRVEPLLLDSFGYWNKIEQFRKDLFRGPVLSLDIDLVIAKDITEEIKKLPTDRLLMCKEPYKDIENSSIIYWSGDYSYLFDEYKNNQQAIVEHYENPKNKLYDQAYIADRTNTDFVENYFSKDAISWKHHKLSTTLGDPSILIFTSSEKPTNNLHLDIVKNNWID